MTVNSNLQMTTAGAVYSVPGPQGIKLLPAVMTDGAGSIIGSVDQLNGTAAVLATEIGGPVQTLYSEPPTTRTASGNTGGLTSNPQVAGMLALFLGMNVTAGAGSSPSMSASIQQQDANGIWQTIATTPALTTVGASNISVGPGTGVMLNGGPYRVAWSLSSGTTSATFQLSLQGR